MTFEGPDPQSFLAGLQAVGGFGVVNGQVIKLKPHDEKKPPEEARWEFKLKESGIWEIKAPQFVLHCEAVDAS